MRIVGLVLVLVMGAIHAYEAPEYFEFATYLGSLFLANVVGAALAAIGILVDRIEAWALGAVTAAATFAAYIVSRTAGLPGLPAEERSEFLEPLGVASLVVEAAFLVLFVVRAAHRRAGPPAGSPRG